MADIPFDVVVIGSINHDLTIHAPRHPGPGETVLGTSHYWSSGGKGANQAVAAARMGSRVAMIGSIGDDESGRELVSSLEAEDIDTAGVRIVPGLGTGLAVITVDADAENTIVVSPGANLATDPDDLTAFAEVIGAAAVVLVQLEIPLDTVRAAARLSGRIFCLNPAPSHPLPGDLLERVDVLIPNRSELAHLSNKEVGTDEDAVAAVAALGRTGPTVVTLGSDGALIVDDPDIVRLPAPDVEAIDPTGAGDAFCGAVASGLAAGLDIEAAARRGVVAGAIAATRRGAQDSMPTAAEVEALLGA